MILEAEYDSETWTTYARQEKRLSSFHLRSIHCILGISWQDRVSKAEVLSWANPPSMFTLLRQCRLRLPHGGWPHPKRHSLWRVGIWKEIQRPPTAALQGFLQERHESTWHQHWVLGGTCMMWRSTLNQNLKSGEEKLMNAEVGQRAHRKKRTNSNRPETTHKCNFCGRDCFSQISLYSHKRRCNNWTDRTTKMYSESPMIKFDRRRP